MPSNFGQVPLKSILSDSGTMKSSLVSFVIMFLLKADRGLVWITVQDDWNNKTKIQ